MKRLVLETEKGKGKSFEALLLSYIVSDGLLDNNSRGAIRPVWCMLAGTESQMKIFLANLKDGAKAQIKSLEEKDSSGFVERMELLKTAGYQYTKKNVLTGIRGSSNLSVVEVWLPEVMLLQPINTESDSVKFLCLTPRWWAEAQFNKLNCDTRLVKAVEGYVNAAGIVDGKWVNDVFGGYVAPKDAQIDAYTALKLLPQAAHFVSYMEKRTRRPILDDLTFFLHLFIKALSSGALRVSKEHKGWAWARYSDYYNSNLSTYETRRAGYLPPLSFNVTHKDLDPFLAEELKIYLEMKRIHGFDTVLKTETADLITALPVLERTKPVVVKAKKPSKIIEFKPLVALEQNVQTQADDIYAEVERLVGKQLAFDFS